jgi:hypothetical protein
MNPPSKTDRVVKVRAFLTDEVFGHDHWRAAQFSAPIDAAPAVLLICRDAAEQASLLMQYGPGLDALKAKIAEFEKRPWPGCRMLSEGDACTCHLCRTERERDALKAEVDHANDYRDAWVEAEQWAKKFREALTGKALERQQRRAQMAIGGEKDLKPGGERP